MKIWLKFCFIAGLCLVLNACAASKVTLPSEEEQKARWEKFITHTIAEKPYILQGSFRFGDKDNTNRVNYIFWSNGALPLRVDVSAGRYRESSHVSCAGKTRHTHGKFW